MFQTLLKNINQSHASNFHAGLKIYHPNKTQDLHISEQGQFRVVKKIEQKKTKSFIQNAISLENQLGPLLESQSYGNQFSSSPFSQILSNKFRLQQNKIIAQNEYSNNLNPFILFQIRKEFTQLKQILHQLSSTTICQIILWERVKQQISEQVQRFISQFVLKINQQMQQQKMNFINKISQNTNKLQGQRDNCHKCKQLQQENRVLGGQLRESFGQLQRLKQQNETLNELVFDMQQKIVGLDIEVQKRFKQLSHASSHHSKQLIIKLQQQIYSLQQKNHKLQSFAFKQKDLQERQKNIIEMEKNIQQSLAHLEQIKKQNYQRELELFNAEQKNHTKMEYLTNKQEEIGEWQNSLAHKSRIKAHQYSEINQHQEKSFINKLVFQSRLKTSPSERYNRLSKMKQQSHSQISQLRQKLHRQTNSRSPSKKSNHSYIIQNKKPISQKKPQYQTKFKKTSELGTKLDRLREQIKKQIESIK